VGVFLGEEEEKAEVKVLWGAVPFHEGGKDVEKDAGGHLGNRAPGGERNAVRPWGRVFTREDGCFDSFKGGFNTQVRPDSFIIKGQPIGTLVRGGGGGAWGPDLSPKSGGQPSHALRALVDLVGGFLAEATQPGLRPRKVGLKLLDGVGGRDAVLLGLQRGLGDSDGVGEVKIPEATLREADELLQIGGAIQEGPDRIKGLLGEGDKLKESDLGRECAEGGGPQGALASDVTGRTVKQTLKVGEGLEGTLSKGVGREKVSEPVDETRILSDPLWDFAGARGGISSSGGKGESDREVVGERGAGGGEGVKNMV